MHPSSTVQPWAWILRLLAVTVTFLAACSSSTNSGSTGTPAAPTGSTAPVTAAGADLPALVRQVEPSVVTVLTESGLGSGGNITVVTKNGTNAYRGSIFDYLRNDAMDSASTYIGADGQPEPKQNLDLNQFGGSVGGPLSTNKTFFFFSFEGLRQKTGLKFTEAVPSDEARRRIMAGEPVGSGQGQTPERTRAVAPLLIKPAQVSLAGTLPIETAPDRIGRNGRELTLASPAPRPASNPLEFCVLAACFSSLP